MRITDFPTSWLNSSANEWSYRHQRRKGEKLDGPAYIVLMCGRDTVRAIISYSEILEL